jgi:PII-like signaling protein
LISIGEDPNLLSNRSVLVNDIDVDLHLPIVVEIVDEDSMINAFLTTLHDLFDQAGCRGLVTLEKVEIIKYLHGREKW